MVRRSSSLAIASLLIVAAAGATMPLAKAQSQAPSRYSQGTTGMNNPALRYFRPTAPTVAPPRVASRRPAPVTPTPTARTPTAATPRRSKPFSDAVLQPTVTPYLALSLLETNAGLPNYHLFVKPQLDQQHQAQVHQYQQQRMQQDLRAASLPPTPTTEGAARFQNYNGYFPLR